MQDLRAFAPLFPPHGFRIGCQLSLRSEFQNSTEFRQTIPIFRTSIFNVTLTILLAIVVQI